MKKVILSISKIILTCTIALNIFVSCPTNDYSDCTEQLLPIENLIEIPVVSSDTSEH